MASGAKPREQPVMDIIVEEIVNLSFFWAQIGTGRPCLHSHSFSNLFSICPYL